MAVGRSGMRTGGRSGARQVRCEGALMDGIDNRTVGMRAGAWLCQVYTIVLRNSKDLGFTLPIFPRHLDLMETRVSV
jgi:hypothetical protein